MGPYFARRFLLLIPTFLGITFLVFCITRFVPGGPIEQAILRMKAAGMSGPASAGVSCGACRSCWPCCRSWGSSR